ncbi:MAG: DUF3800 domain-containing protein [Euryarchaeota archaeon]|nr:DUF3800 domain-containing protein [Euryarchaeota archaeon]MDE1835473.1 DUF3800 domain-containing protein [Euryarchaeota archaeon]MDE1880366.1 DUF3800 domain-containing protein [Euryarchaeota archaeon]MDE2045754.1 DUF3800 domain-containing protein [Thermoplasmata archaeon]
MSILNLFTDGSGHADYRPPIERGDTDHYCLAGILVSDTQRDQIEAGCDSIVRRYFPHREPRTVELKASWISARTRQRSPWDALPGPRHAQLFDELRDLILSVRPLLFGQVLHKENYRTRVHASRPERPATNAFRYMLGRVARHLEGGDDTTRVTVDTDSRAIEEALRALETSVRTGGDRIIGVTTPPVVQSQWNRLLPCLHLASENSRCIQVADYVAHWLWSAAEYGKATRLRELDPLWRRYDGRREPWVAFLDEPKEKLIKN